MTITKNNCFWLLLILILASILRFYRLSDYTLFLGDQGRDVLIAKRMIIEHKWTLLGPNASVGGFFTGPIYYYFILPFLWAFNLDPVGPVYLSALFGILTVLLTFVFCRVFFNNRTGLIAAFLIAISPKMIEISRYSWNPNPMPFFSLLTILLFHLSVLRRNLFFTFLCGVSLGILFQLHYIDLIFVPIIYLAVIFIYPLKKAIIQWVILTIGFIVGDSMFLIFEIKHEFPNLKSVFEFITRRGQTVAPRSANFVWLFQDILKRLYEMTLFIKDQKIYIFVYFSLIALTFWSIKTLKNKTKRDKVIILLSWLIIGVFGIGSYRGELHEHYFGYLYPLPFILLGLGSDCLLKKKVITPLFVAGLIFLTYISVKNLYFWQEPHFMFKQVKEIDRIVLDFAENKPYNLALISGFNSDYSYRYFLEIWGEAPIVIENPENDPQRASVTEQLIVICETKKCEPLGHSLWEIAGFGRAEIEKETVGPADIRIFKLKHYNEKN